MNVILLEKIQNLGNLGDQVTVKGGYARNFLLPKNKAVMATPKNIEEFDARRAELEAKANDALAAANERKEKLEAISVAIPSRASEDGKLYGSVGPRDITVALLQAGAEVQKSEIQMPEGAIRDMGEYDVKVALHTDVTAMVKVTVVAE